MLNLNVLGPTSMDNTDDEKCYSPVVGVPLRI